MKPEATLPQAKFHGVLLRVEWDPKQERDCQAAEMIFNGHQRDGNPIFSTDKKWNPKDPLKEFDKNPGRMIVMPRLTVWDKLREEP